MPSITKGLQFEGKQVALPYDVGPFVMFYNKDAFKAAGLKEPAIGWTTDDFMSDAKALTKPPKYGFWAQSDIGQLLPVGAELLRQVGVERRRQAGRQQPRVAHQCAVVHRPGQQGEAGRPNS